MRLARKGDLISALAEVRGKTLWLLDQVPEDFLKVRIHSFYSPIGWHFGHIGRTEEFWVVHRACGGDVQDDRLSFLFADLPENPKDNRINLPSKADIVAYLEQTRARALQALHDADLRSECPFLQDGYAWEFAIQHECQHQETICEMLQLIQRAQNPSPGAPYGQIRSETESQMVRIPAGQFTMGSSRTHDYDNEKMPHEVEVAQFDLDRCPVTAGDWKNFIDDAGYRRKELWTAEGWKWRQHEDARAPEYWIKARDTYAYVGPKGVRDIDPHEPVSSISWHEANAYAKWSGKRLPTEAEWEYAAAFSPSGERAYPWGDEPAEPNNGSFGVSRFDPGPVGQRPAGASFFGILDMAGGIWEWTASPFLSYPGFEAFPYDGYSKKHMDGKHYVCRGGSWATAARLLRCTFRNWYVPSYRQGFLGLRCAR